MLDPSHRICYHFTMDSHLSLAIDFNGIDPAKRSAAYKWLASFHFTKEEGADTLWSKPVMVAGEAAERVGKIILAILKHSYPGVTGEVIVGSRPVEFPATA